MNNLIEQFQGLVAELKEAENIKVETNPLDKEIKSKKIERISELGDEVEVLLNKYTDEDEALVVLQKRAHNEIKLLSDKRLKELDDKTVKAVQRGTTNGEINFWNKVNGLCEDISVEKARQEAKSN
jgi:hypothetical protein